MSKPERIGRGKCDDCERIRVLYYVDDNHGMSARLCTDCLPNF